MIKWPLEALTKEQLQALATALVPVVAVKTRENWQTYWGTKFLEEIEKLNGPGTKA